MNNSINHSLCTQECNKCNKNIATWMPFSPYHIDNSEIDEELLNKYKKYYMDLINELKKISIAYKINYEDMIISENLPYVVSLDIKEQLEYYYSLFENEEDYECSQSDSECNFVAEEDE